MVDGKFTKELGKIEKFLLMEVIILFQIILERDKL